MQKTIKLILCVDENLEKELKTYERMMKHEIYKIAGVFKKRNHVFAFRLRYINNQIPFYAKDIVRKQAQRYYEDTRKGKHPILDFSGIWEEHLFSLDMRGVLYVKIREEKSGYLRIPFCVYPAQIQRLQKGVCKRVTIKQRNEHWFAFVEFDIA